MARWSAAWPLGNHSIEATLPTRTPRIFTLASGFITSPARWDRTVTGTVRVKLPWNKPTATAMMAAMTTTVPNPASGRTRDWGTEVAPR